MVKLTPRQSYAFHRATSGKYNFILYGGAIKGAKTFWLLIMLAHYCSKYPRSRWGFIRKDMRTIIRNTYPAVQKLMDLGLKDYCRPMVNGSLRFYNGSEIFFMGENFDKDKELTRFAGLDVSGFALDEINELNEATFYKCLERAGTFVMPEGFDSPMPQVLASCNPTKAWPKRLIYEPYQKGTLQDNWNYIHARIYDNPHIDQALIESLRKNLPPLLFRRFVDGDWDAFEVKNAFCTAFDRDKHVRPCAISHDHELRLSIDFNLQPFGLVAFQDWYDTDGHHIRIVDELSIDNGSIPEMIRLIKERYRPWFHKLKLTGDAMGNHKDLSQRDNASYYMQIMRGCGLRESQIVVPRANPTHENSRSDTNYVFYHHPDIQINPGCVNVIRDMESVEVNDQGQIIKKNRKKEEQLADHLDCVRYFINTFMHGWIDRHQRMYGLEGVK